MSNIINTIIVDDHPHAIDHLSGLLKQRKNILVIDSAQNADEAFLKIKNKKPDLIFLDVEMPEKSGFELLNDLSKHGIHLPEIIFITGYNNYAIEALRSRALDYLLKPVTEVDLDKAILRYYNNSNNSFKTSKEVVFSEILKQLSLNDRIFIPTVTGFKSINTSEILFIKRLGDSFARVFLYYDKIQYDTIPACYSLKQVLEMLTDRTFFQIDRNVIINTDYLKEVEIKGRECILEKNGEKTVLTISRQRLKEFKLKFCPGLNE